MTTLSSTSAAGQKTAGLWFRLNLGLIIFSCFGTLASRLLHLDPGIIAPVAAGLVILTGALVALSEIAECHGWKTALQGGLVILGIGAGFELLGVYTGFPFGRYAYTGAWQPNLVLPGSTNFPLLLPFAWLMVVGSLFVLLRHGSVTGTALRVGLAAATIDFFMEGVLTSTLRYWKWLEPSALPGGAPLANIAGWFGVSFAGAVIVAKLAPNTGSRPCRAGYSLAAYLAFLALLAGLDSGALAIDTVGPAILALCVAFLSRKPLR